MNKNWIELFFNVLFWAITTWLVLSLFTIEIQEIEIVGGQEVETFIRNIELTHIFLWGQFFFAIYFYLQLYLIKRLNYRVNTKNMIIQSLLLGAGTLFLFYITIRILRLYESEVYFIPTISYVIFMFYAAVALSYGFIKVWIKNVRDKDQLELVKNQAELNLLKSQLQPHFLFNTLNNLLAMVNQESNPRLAKSIDKLSGLLRYVVYETKKEKVRIAEEIAFIQNFAELHLLRFEDDEVDFQFNIKGPYDQQLVEPGIFICYIENAFKHGVTPEEKSFITIDLDISEKDRLGFYVENSIPSMVKNEKAGGFGMASNEERLRLAYPHKHSIQISGNGVFKVELIIETDESYHSR